MGYIYDEVSISLDVCFALNHSNLTTFFGYKRHIEELFPYVNGFDERKLYLQLLGRVFIILRENNPKLSGERRHIVTKPPQKKNSVCQLYGSLQDILTL